MGERKVFKYPVQQMDRWTLNLPRGAQMLMVQMQGDTPFMWALVEPDAPLTIRHFRLAGTGHPIKGYVAHIGSFQMYAGELVFHLFEELP